MTTRTAAVVLLGALALLAPGCAHRYPRHLSPEALEARGIRIVGNHVVDREDVAGLARCQGEGTPAAACSFDELWGLYDRRGHPRATFELRRVADPSGRVLHELVVDEGPFFRVARVEVEGLEEVDAARGWREGLPLVPGEPFSAYALAQGKDELLAALRGLGYGDAEVVERVDPDLRASTPGSYAMVARYVARPGARGAPWRIGAVAVSDADPHRKARIAREVERFLRAGEPFGYGRFVAARARLRAYPTAALLIAKPTAGLHEVVVVVRVSR